MIFDLRTLVHVYLMFVVYRTKGLKYNFFYLCVGVCACVCLCMYFLLYCNAYLFRNLFVGSNSSNELSRSCPQNIYDTFTCTVL